MATYTRNQADSLWIDVSSDSVPDIDSVWNNWSANWNIKATVTSSTVLLSGALTNSSTPGLFQLRIGPIHTTGWSLLPVGSYSLTIEINNSTVDYRYEEQHQLVIKPQGI